MTLPTSVYIDPARTDSLYYLGGFDGAERYIKDGLVSEIETDSYNRALTDVLKLLDADFPDQVEPYISNARGFIRGLRKVYLTP